MSGHGMHEMHGGMLMLGAGHVYPHGSAPSQAQSWTSPAHPILSWLAQPSLKRP